MTGSPIWWHLSLWQLLTRKSWSNAYGIDTGRNEPWDRRLEQLCVRVGLNVPFCLRYHPGLSKLPNMRAAAGWAAGHHSALG